MKTSRTFSLLFVCLLGASAFAKEESCKVFEFSGTSNGDNLVWERGKTYLVSSDYTLDNGSQLIIEPGAIVKLNGDTGIFIEDGATLVAKGAPRDYILITSAEDNTVGQEITQQDGLVSRYYDTAFSFMEDSGSSSAVQYCKFRKGHGAIFIENVSLDEPIKHNIFDIYRDNVVYLQDNGDVVPMVNTLFNNLFVMNSKGQSADSGIVVETLNSNAMNDIVVNIFHNTFDGGSRAVWMYNDSGESISLNMQNNIIANTTNSINGPVKVSGDNINFVNTRANVFYNCAGTLDSAVPTAENPVCSSNPFDTTSNPNGRYYLNQSGAAVNIFSGEQVSDIPVRFQQETALRATKGPQVVTSNIPYSMQAQIAETDGEADDAGYHYDRVDYVVSGIRTVSGTLTIPAGCIVTFDGGAAGMSGLDFGSGGFLVAKGDSGLEIFFTTTWASSDGFETPFGKLTDVDEFSEFLKMGVHLSNNYTSLDTVSALEMCRFRDNAHPVIGRNMANSVRHCVFGYPARNGVVLYDDDSLTEFENCLFNKVYAAIEPSVDPSDPPPPPGGSLVTTAMNNCTVYGCDKVFLSYGVNLNVTKRNCIFAGNEYVIKGYSGAINDPGSDNNITWNNFYEVMQFEPEEYYNPLFAHKKSNGEEIRASHVPDGFYLAQEENNVSRRPLRCWDVADEDGIVCSKSGLNVSVCASYEPMGGSETPKGTLTNGAFSDNGRQSNTDWPILLTVTGDNTAWNEATDTITLKVLSFNGEPENEGMEETFPWLEMKSTDVTVYLPDLTFAPGGETCKFWVADDGSTFNATSGGTPGSTVNQSAKLAMEYDSTGPAACAYENRRDRTPGDVMQKWLAAKSPAVNAGTEDGYDYDSTSTRETKIDQGKPDVGYHYYRRVSDDDPVIPGQQEIRIIFSAPREAVRETQRYTARAGNQQIWVVHSPDKEKIVGPLYFDPPLLSGTHEIYLTTESVDNIESERSMPVNVLVNPDPISEENIHLRASIVGEGGAYWDEETQTLYYNDSGVNIEGFKAEVSVDGDEDPWKVNFGKRDILGEEDEWRHFGDYEVFPTPSE